MAKFNELPEAEQIMCLKNEFVRIIEDIIKDDSKIKKLIPEDKIQQIMEFIPTLKPKECKCGECIMVEKLDGRVPAQLECLVDVARNRCNERSY